MFQAYEGVSEIVEELFIAGMRRVGQETLNGLVMLAEAVADLGLIGGVCARS